MDGDELDGTIKEDNTYKDTFDAASQSMHMYGLEENKGRN